MKNKLTILLIFAWFAGFSQTVPNHDHFTLGMVAKAVYGDSAVGRNTSSLFADSDAGKFDPNYGSKTMNPQTINGFRNYGNGLLATIVNYGIYAYSDTWASCYSEITSNGGASVTASGICWSASANPTTSNNHTTDGASIGVFSSTATGLSGVLSGNVYYVRSYATNSAGTAYSDNVQILCNRVNIGGTLTEFILYSTTDGTPLTADNICSLSPGTLTGMVHGETQPQGMADGTDIYLYWTSEDVTLCNRVPDGYYFAYFNPKEEGDPFYRVYISGGKIYTVNCPAPCSINTENNLTCITTAVSLTVDCSGNYTVSFTYQAGETCIGYAPQLSIFDASHNYIGMESVSGSWSGNTYTGSGILSTGLSDGYYVSIDLYQ